MEVVLYINYVNRKEAESDGNGSDHANEPEKRPPQWLQTDYVTYLVLAAVAAYSTLVSPFFLLI